MPETEARTSGANTPCVDEFRVGERVRCTSARATVHGTPDGQSVSELLRGETFVVEGAADGWLGGTCAHDGYPGHIRAADVCHAGDAPTHRIVARDALVFARADTKAPLVGRVPMGALVAAAAREEQGPFVAIEDGFVHRLHIAPLATIEADPVAVALRFVGSPYLWGGRSPAGIDCSGLIQVTLGLCGIDAPRDSGPQRTLGREVMRGDAMRGDLVFFPGHVGILTDPVTLLHANAHWMTTLAEPLADVVDRLRPTCREPVLAVRRLG